MAKRTRRGSLRAIEKRKKSRGAIRIMKSTKLRKKQTSKKKREKKSATKIAKKAVRGAATKRSRVGKRIGGIAKKTKKSGIMSAKAIAEKAEAEFISKELASRQTRPILRENDIAGLDDLRPVREAPWIEERAPTAEKSPDETDKSGSPVMKVVRGLIKEKSPKGTEFDPNLKDLQLRRQSLLADIDAKREEMQRIPRNSQHKAKIIELSKQLTSLKQQLWKVEKELESKAKE